MKTKRGELERIARLASRFSLQTGAGVERAIGDDAAILAPLLLAGAAGAAGERRGSKLVWTVDAQVEKVHFREDLVSWKEEGWRSFMAAASDLAAMGATPWCALSSLVLRADLDDESCDALGEGQAEAALAIGAPIVGGNLSRGDAVSITTTLLGSCDAPLERLAQPGDGIWVAGELGLAAAGLAALERKLDVQQSEVAGAVQAWRRPHARIAEGIAMRGIARGAIDVSDGLARDVGHMARGSAVRAVIEEAALCAHVGPTLASIASRLGVNMLGLALHGGEDYALVAASAVPIPGFARVGRFEAGEGVALESPAGTKAIEAKGYDHFR